MWKPKGEEGMSAAESAGSESSSTSAASDFPSTSSYASDQQPASTSSAVPAADADSATSDPSSSEAASSSPGADTAAGPSGQNSDSDFGGLTSDQQLCEVGTFAQVHTIVPIDPKRAQLLLLGHRRLKCTKQVISTYLIWWYVKRCVSKLQDPSMVDIEICPCTKNAVCDRLCQG